MADDNFEIRIEAYIDGVLPPHERAEVERQLMTSPRHRRIVDQLMQARHLIATLPRVNAPADLLESIDPSLERAALFDIPRETRRRKLVSPQVAIREPLKGFDDFGPFQMQDARAPLTVAFEEIEAGKV